MKLTKNRTLAAAAIVSAFFPLAASAAPLLDLTGQGYYTYGNTNSYSLPILAYQYDLAHNSGTGPGNPFYVDSSAGQIKDLVVIYTGSSGQGVTTNPMGFEDAYETPGGSSPQFASTTGVNVISPTGTDGKGIQTIDSKTWDANLAALKAFLDGGTPLFLFNNNDTNEDQNLAIWAKLWITGPDDSVYKNRYLYLSNNAQTYGLGGVPLGNAATYNPGDVLPGFYGNGKTDYVLSGGAVCVDSTTGQVIPGLQPPCGSGADKIDHNLGANQAAYAADVPLLNMWLKDLSTDPQLAQYSLHLQLNLGCDPALGGNCANFKIDNGYEQLFLASAIVDNTIPEPTSLALAGLGLFGAFTAQRRRTRAK